MMIDRQSTGRASPTGLALHYSGEEMHMDNATEYLEWARCEMAALIAAGKTAGLRYDAVARHLAAAGIIINDPALAHAPRLTRETDIRDWAVRILSPFEMAKRMQK
jgi:hypothetical protein